MRRFHSLIPPALLLVAAILALTLPPLAARRGAEALLARASARELQPLASHLVVGWRDDAELDKWVKARLVGGLYVTRRNLEGRTVAELRARLASLQAWRASRGLPPLWIMADQEGGPVSHLSPQLTRLPALGSLPALGPESVRAYADVHARELADLGVNVNLAPVVDLAPPWKENPGDRHTRLDARAIAADPDSVARVAHRYCARLLEGGINPVLKHFPGLGRVREDTHVSGAVVVRPARELERSDWIPFKALSDCFPVWIMLSHAVLADVDPASPVSQSRPVVEGLLRRAWRADNVLITDDMCMAPYRESPGGIGAGAVRSLNAGVDLLLVSHHPVLGDRVLAALLRAHRRGEIDAARLADSDRRLRRARLHGLFSSNSR